jgi:hypothetical protein
MAVRTLAHYQGQRQHSATHLNRDFHFGSQVKGVYTHDGVGDRLSPGDAISNGRSFFVLGEDVEGSSAVRGQVGGLGSIPLTAS